MTGQFVRVASYQRSIEALQRVGRLALGALAWAVLVAIFAAPMLAAYACGRASG